MRRLKWHDNETHSDSVEKLSHSHNVTTGLPPENFRWDD